MEGRWALEYLRTSTTIAQNPPTVTGTEKTAEMPLLGTMRCTPTDSVPPRSTAIPPRPGGGGSRYFYAHHRATLRRDFRSTHLLSIVAIVPTLYAVTPHDSVAQKQADANPCLTVSTWWYNEYRGNTYTQARRRNKWNVNDERREALCNSSERQQYEWIR